MQKRAIPTFFFGCFILFFLAECGNIQAEKQKAEKLTIELGQTFANDGVKIYLDKKLVYNKLITTPDSSRITDVFEVKKPAKAYTLTVEINGSRFEKSSPKNQKELNTEDYSLLIDFNREAEEVEIKTKTVIILYD